MLRNRVIPMLLLHEGGLYKTTGFRKPVYVGDPINVVRIFNEKECDEIVVLDISASKHGRGPNLEVIEEIVGECFMPLTYGGGIRSETDAAKVLDLGVEKVAIQTAALSDIRVLSRVAEASGVQSVVASVDVRRARFGRPRLYASSTGDSIKRHWLEYLEEVQRAGAGEILLTSVDREGSMEGLDIEMIREAARVCSVPLIAAGGVGTLLDIAEGIGAGADAIGVGSFVVFKGRRRAVLITYPGPDDLKGVLR